MTRILLITISFILISCNSHTQNHNQYQNITPSIANSQQSVEQFAEMCCEQYYEATKANNLDKYIAITYGIGEWGDKKSEEERYRFEDAMVKWAKANPYKSDRINEFYRKHREVIPK